MKSRRLATLTTLFALCLPLAPAPGQTPAPTPQATPAAPQPDATRLRTGTRLTLGRDLQPGEYVFQVVVTDPLADPKHAVATQWIDFEVVE